MASKNILITGFGPFPGQPVNPSAELAKRLAAEFNARVLILPTEYDAAPKALAAEIAREQPDFLVCLGVAGNSAAVRIEARACNFAHPNRADAAGFYPPDSTIVPGGPEYLYSALDIQGAAAASGADRSEDAGDYLCNFIYYTALREGMGRRGPVFIHIPDPARPGSPAAESIAATARAAVQSLLPK